MGPRRAAGRDGEDSRGGRTVRRLLVVVLVAVGVVLGAYGSALADFAAQRTVTTGVATGSVTPPGDVRATASCGDWVSLATVSWRDNPTRGVDGYTITARRDNGATSVWREVGGSSTSATSLLFNGSGYTFTVTADTSSGWTAQSVASNRIAC